MNVLFCGYNHESGALESYTFSNLVTSTPYGHDIIVINPTHVSSFIGTHGTGEAINRWSEYLPRWLGGHHKLIVVLEPNLGNNYTWQNLPNFSPDNIQTAGHNPYIRSVVASDGYTKSFLNDNDEFFDVQAYYTENANVPNIHPNSFVDEGLLTSFSWKSQDKEVIFIPTIALSRIFKLVQSLESGSTQWSIQPAKELQSKINGVDGKIQQLEEQKSQLSDSLIAVNNSVNTLINSDLYLKRSINSFSRTQSSDSPNPENFYEAIEAVENAFQSEREMRENLGVTKSKIDKVMRRTNQFRHVAKDGQPPEPLSQEEITEFTQIVDDIIHKYIEYLYNSEA
jgi:hypothetical protein